MVPSEKWPVAWRSAEAPTLRVGPEGARVMEVRVAVAAGGGEDGAELPPPPPPQAIIRTAVRQAPMAWRGQWRRGAGDGEWACMSGMVTSRESPSGWPRC